MTKTETKLVEISARVDRLATAVKILAGLVVLSLSGHPVPLSIAKLLLP